MRFYEKLMQGYFKFETKFEKTIGKNPDLILIGVTGRVTLLELKMKLLLSRDKNEAKGMPCSKVKNMVFNKYSKYLDKKDKKIIENAVCIRNKLVHFELHEILKKQRLIPNKVVQGTVDHTDSKSILKVMQQMSEGKGTPIDQNSSLYGQYLELSSNPMRIQKLSDILDKAINIVTRVAVESTGTERNK